MSAYSSYHSPSSFDTGSHAHIPSIATINRQPYNDDSTSLPPMHTGASGALPLPSNLMRDSHNAYQSDSPVSSSAGPGLSHYAPPQQSFHGGSSMATSQPPMYSSSNYSPASSIQSYNTLSNPPSASHNGVYGQSPLPPVSSALYGSSIDNNPLNGYSSASSMPLRSSQYQQDDIALDNLVSRQSRRDATSANTSQPNTGRDGSIAASSALAGAKNAEGKFPCQICNKTYQHQKHLKRHNLRHTGERPYRCHLCHETFCRSDILKRHFAKCSIRRGNPEGITHLTHAQDHLKKPPQESTHTSLDAQAHTSSGSADSSARTRAHWANEGGQYPHAGNSVPQHVNNGSNGSSRSSSVIPPGSSGSGADDKRHHPATSHTLPPLQSSLDIPSNDPMAYNYDQHNAYSRNGYGQNDSVNEHGIYQQMPSSSAPFMMQHSNAYSLPSHSAPYQSMSQSNVGANGHWLGESSPFHANNHDSIMYPSS